MSRELERSGTRERPLSRIESRVARQGRQQDSRLAGLESSPLAAVRVLQGVELTTSTQSVEHGLNRAWSGAWIVGDSGSHATLTRSSTSNNEVFIGLAASAAGTYDVAVF